MILHQSKFDDRMAHRNNRSRAYILNIVFSMSFFILIMVILNPDKKIYFFRKPLMRKKQKYKSSGTRIFIFSLGASLEKKRRGK